MAMKFIGAFLAYVVMGLLLGVGIYLMVHGKLWLFLLGFAAYLLAFARFGCRPH